MSSIDEAKLWVEEAQRLPGQIERLAVPERRSSCPHVGLSVGAPPGYIERRDQTDKFALQFGDSFIKLGVRNGSCGLVDYFALPDVQRLGRCDLDLSSGGPVLLTKRDRLVGGGKTGTLYVFNSSNRQSALPWLVDGLDQYRDASHLCHWEGGPPIFTALLRSGTS